MSHTLEEDTLEIAAKKRREYVRDSISNYIQCNRMDTRPCDIGYLNFNGNATTFMFNTTQAIYAKDDVFLNSPRITVKDTCDSCKKRGHCGRTFLYGIDQVGIHLSTSM